MTDPFDDKGIHLKGFPDSTLLDIARNGAAQRDYRLTAVEILKVRKSRHINHPDIQGLVQELEIELDGIEFEHPAPSGALTASVTTKTMAEDVEVIDNTPARGKSIPTQNIIIRPGGFIEVPESEEAQTDVPPTEPETISTEPKPRRTRKPKEPVDAPQPE